MTMRELYITLVELTESKNILLVEELPPCGVKHLRGLFWNNEEGSMIWINPTLSLAQKISTLAHELGHFMLHRETGYSILESGTTDNQREREATEYGRRLIRFLISIWNTP